VPRVVARNRLTAASALMAMSANAGVIVGSALGGLLAAGPGPWLVYTLDVVSFTVSLVFLWLLRPLPAAPRQEPAPGQAGTGQAGTGQAGSGHEPAPGLRSVLASLRYAWGRKDLLGSYIADLAAMTSAHEADFCRELVRAQNLNALVTCPVRLPPLLMSEQCAAFQQRREG
jgi:MFS family permease